MAAFASWNAPCTAGTAHAGLTVGSWRALDEPVTAGTAADLLNTRMDDIIWGDDGPLWAETGPMFFAWAGDENNSMMSYIDVNWDFSQFDRDNSNRS